MVKPRTMPGVLELLPSEQITFQRMLDTIRSVYERYGFVPVETPVIELTEVLLTKTGGETERQVYFVQSTGSLENDAAPELALRFDLTVPLARYVAEHEHHLAFPFRRYQIQRVYRGESPQRGRFREFYQCDIDVIGRDRLSVRYDAEMPAVIADVFTALGIGPFTIRINNRKLMRGLLSEFGVSDEGEQAAVLREVDKLEKRGVGAVAETLHGRHGLSETQAAALLDTVQTATSSFAEAFDLLDRVAAGNDLTEEGAAELRTVFESLQAMGVDESLISLDLSIARGLDYYTGTVYETTLDEHPQIGSICSGGRYDDLAGHYTTSRLPGVGISIGLTRLFWQLREVGLVEGARSIVDAYVTLMDDEGLEYALELTRRLRQAGLSVVCSVESSKLGKQLKLVDRSGIRFALIAGEDERDRGTVTVKDLSEQTQHELSIGDAADHILSIRSTR